jgi:hypothetical protein
VTATYADIHPTGDFPSMVLGHFFSMEAATIPEKDTLGYKIASRLSSSASALSTTPGAFLPTIATTSSPTVVRGMGMQTRVTLSPPYDFIPKPQAINQRVLRPTASLASAPVTESRPRSHLFGFKLPWAT